MRTDREQLRARLAAIVERYHRVQAAAAAEPALAGRLRRLRKFQAERLACTYADLRAQPRYRKAVEFFLSDLYGPADLSARDEQVLRALDKLERFLPGGALEAFAGAMEVHVLTQELDADTARALPRGDELDAAGYANAYRKAGRGADRARQIDLVMEIGAVLDRIVRHPEIGFAIRISGRPAHAAGYGDLHDFIQRGWKAFDDMAGAGEFLETVSRRERELMARALAGDASAFSRTGA
ncbi:MAG: hypothetical protein KA224_02195 [Steroidobacteraceae bacterium]|nr:hypothetical protein [Steroidobacteraceae bacterium]MCC7199573.1 hypothetical protein [Gammaproteobacteria bacterium]